MEKEIITIDNFDAQLDMATGYENNQNTLPIYKFDAVNGVWNVFKGKKDDDGKAVYEEYKEKLKAHLINVAHRVIVSGDKSPVKVFSFESASQVVELIDSEDRKTVIANGSYKDLKPEYDLRQTINTYGFIDDELAKIKISGFASISWYRFLNATGNPAKFLLEFSPNRRMKGLDNAPAVQATKEEIATYEGELKAGKKPKLNLFYEGIVKIVKDLTKDEEGKTKIIEAVNEVNELLTKKNSSATLSAVPDEAKPVDDVPTIQIEDVPFESENKQKTLDEAKEALG